MKHFELIKRLTIVVCTLLSYNAMASAAYSNAEILNLENGEKIILSKSNDLFCDNATDGGLIDGDQTGCADPTYDPYLITSVTLPSGGSGTLEYIWIYTTDDPDSPTVIWNPIPGSTNPTYDPEPVSETTTYRRCARRSGCTEYVAESNYAIVTVNCCDNVTDGGTIEKDQWACGDAIDPDPITSVTPPTGGSGDIEYIWLKSTACSDYYEGNTDWMVIPGSNSPSYDPGVLTEQTCFIRCARRKGCTDYIGESNIVTITPHPKPYVDITVNKNPKCIEDGKLTAVGSGGTAPYSYSWSTGASTAMIDNLGGGTYTVTVTDAHLCVAVASVTLSEPESPSISVDHMDVSCSDASDGMATATASGGASPYAYSFSAGDVTDNKASNLAPGTHSVTVTDANGCTASTSFSIAKPSPVYVNIEKNSDAKCDNSGKLTASATGGTGPYTYKWNTGDETAMISGLGAGTYTVTATDAKGCTNVQSETLYDSEAPSVSVADDNLDCKGDDDGSLTATVSGGQEPYTYAWSNGASTATISGLYAGIYSVTVTDAHGCKGYASGEVKEPTKLILTTSGVDEKCEEGNGSVSADVSGGTPPYSYAWSNGGSTATITGLSAGTYSVTITDANGCTKASSETIENIGGPSVNAEGSDLECYDDSNGTAWANATGGTAPLSYLWSNGATTANISGLVAGTYTVTVTDANGCIATAEAKVTQPSKLTVDAYGTDATCGYDNGSASASAAGGTAPYTYAWSNGASGPTVDNLAAGTYTVTATDANGCTAKKTVTINNIGGPSLSATGSDLKCNGDDNGTASASASGGTAPYTYEWSNGATSASIGGLIAGTYTVTVTDANGCKATASATVTEPSKVTVTVTGKDETCGDGNGSATASAAGGTPGYTYNWSNGDSGATITDLAAGTYNVTATDSNGCKAYGSVTIDNQEGPSVTAEGSDLKCYDDSNGTAWANASGGTVPLSYLWSNGATTANISGLAAGLYSVTVTDANGCTATAEAEVTQPSKLTVDAYGTDATCGHENGSANASASGGTAPYTYAWSNGASGAAVDNLAAGTYTVTATDTNGCTAKKTVTINNIGGPSLSTTGSDLKCNGDNNGTASASASGGTAPYTYEWSNGANSASISGLSAGTYTVTVTDANGCKASASATVTEPSKVTVTVTDKDETCGDSNGSATATAAGGTPGYTYNWSNGDSGATITGLSAGTYDVTATDANGCKAYGSVTIKNQEGPSLTAEGSDLKCKGDADGTASANASGGTAPLTYLWSTGATTANISGLSAGTYTVTVTDDNGCTATASATVSEPPLLTVSAQGNDATCGSSNGSATASASGGTPGYTYNWSNGATGASIDNLAAGTYDVTVTDANGCTASTSVTISNIGGPSVSATGSDLKCNGDDNGTANATTTGGTAPYSYAWSTGATTAAISGLNAGTYTVTVTDDNGCKDYASATVTEPSKVTVTVTGKDETCGDGNGSATATAAGGTPGYTYNWSNGDSGATITGLSAGTYNVTATDANGCKAYGSVTIKNQEGPSLTAEGSDLKCKGDADGTASANASGGTAPLTYLWSTGATTANISGLSAGTYTVTVTDANGCTATATATVSEPPLLTVSAQGNDATCGSSNGSATASASGGTPGYTYNWSNGVTGASIDNLAAGTYDVTATDANGCTASTSVTISNIGGPSVSATGSDLKCNGDDNGTANATVTGGTAPYSYAWSTGATTAAISGLNAGTYTVTVTDDNGCKDYASATVTEPSKVTVTVTGKDETCGDGNGSATATAAGGTPGYTYNWSNGDSGATITGLSAGTYDVTATDANGCKAYGSVTIKNQEGPSLTAEGSDLKCKGDADGTASANASGGTAPLTYLWSTGATTANISGLSAGTYTITVTDANGCTATASATVSEPPLLTVSAQGNDATCGSSNGSATASASGGTPGYTYNWSNGATGASIDNLAAGTYDVTATDANGCTASTSVTISNIGGPSVSATGSDLKCNGDDNGTANATATGGTAPYSYAWSTGATTAAISGLSAGTYTVTVTDDNGCKDYASATVTEPSKVTVTVTGKDETCGDSNGSATASASGGTPGYTYNWSNGDSGSTITGLAAGTYDVTVTDSNGCKAYGSVTIYNQEGPSLVAEGSKLLCHGDSDGTAWANASGGTAPLTYLWSNGATTANIGGLAAGTYSVTVTDANGCTATATTVVTQPDPLEVTATKTDAKCDEANGTASASASGGTPGYTYNWSNGDSGANISGLAQGSYTVTATDANGCKATATVYVDNIPGPTVAIKMKEDVSCYDGNDGSATAEATGGTPGYSYFWSTGTVGATANNLGFGSYTVTVVDANGCEASTTVEIDQPTELKLQIVLKSIPGCDMSGELSSTVIGGTPAYTYLWSTGATGSSISGLGGGTYGLTVTDSNGCTVEDEITIEDSEPGYITVSVDDILCYGESTGKATATLIGGTEPVTWSFSGGTQSGNMASNLSAGTYSVTATDALGCVATKSFTVSEPPELKVSTTSENGGCDDLSGKATVSISGGTPSYSILWSTGETTAMISGLEPGNYGVTVTDANGCTTKGVAVVADLPDLTCSSKDIKKTTCYDGDDGQATAVAIGGQAPYTYVWSNGSTDATATDLSAGTYTFTITDANGCKCNGSVVINQPEEVVCSAAVTQEISGYNKSDGRAKVTATGGAGVYTYLWSDGQTTMTALNLAAGNYSVTVTDINGCKCYSDVSLKNPSQLGDKVWYDVNGNGTQDAGEVGVPGVKVTLTNLDDDSMEMMNTDANGMYLFDGLMAGNYKVTFDLPENFVFSPQNQGAEDTDSDADPTTGMTDPVFLGMGESNLDQDAGIVRKGINVGDYVWIDTNQNGIQDFNEDGVGGVKVTLTNTDDNSMEMMVTDSDGRYLFEWVAPGKYKITFSDLPAGYTLTDQDQGENDELDSDADPMNGMTDEFMVMLGDPDDLSFDAGIHLICDNVTDAGSIEADQKLCGTYDAAPLTNVRTPSGGNGELEYLWLKNESNSTTIPAFSDPNWIEIPNSNQPNYDPYRVTTTTFYVRCVRRKGCETYTESNVVRIEYCPLPTVNVTYEIEGTCLGDALSFTADNAGPGAAYYWTFSGASPSTATGREVSGIVYQSEGLKKFTLEVIKDDCSNSEDYDIWIGCEAGLNFDSFNATATDDNDVQLDWTLDQRTADNEYFIEHSADGDDYRVVGSVQGTEDIAYNFMVEQPKLGNSFFRVKHVSRTGDYVISESVQVILKEGAVRNMFAYPNPALDYVKLELFKPLDEDGMLYVIDGLGRVVIAKTVGSQLRFVEVDLSQLKGGMYFIEVQYDGFKKYRQKLFKAVE